MEWIAHRGVPALEPENTAASFIRALSYHPDQIECDVQRTRDGRFIIFHDICLNRTTDGSGKVSEKDWKDLKKLQVKGQGKSIPGGILLLEEFLELIPESIIMNVEIKKESQDPYPWEKDLARVIFQKRDYDSVIISSLHHPALKNVAEISPKIRLGMALEGELLNLEDYIKHLNFSLFSYHPCVDYVTKGGVETLHKIGIKVFAWTVNDRQTCLQMQGLGVDGVMTDRLHFIRERTLCQKDK